VVTAKVCVERDKNLFRLGFQHKCSRQESGVGYGYLWTWELQETSEKKAQR